MLGAARNEQDGVIEHARRDGAHCAADVALLIDVAVITRGLACDEGGAKAGGFVSQLSGRPSELRSRSAHPIPKTSRASARGAWATASVPDHLSLMPITTTSFALTSTPAEQLATEENAP